MSDNELPLWRTISRASDPQTSKQAAREVVADGTVARAKRRALKAVSDHPGSTARELATLIGVRSIHRRLTELDREERVVRDEPRICGVTGRRAATWRPV